MSCERTKIAALYSFVINGLGTPYYRLTIDTNTTNRSHESSHSGCVLFTASRFTCSNSDITGSAVINMTSTVVFITGANRGLGLGLLQKYLAQPNYTVIAGNRNLDHPSSQALANLPKGEGSKLIVVKLDASIDQDAFTAVKELKKRYGINHFDIVIANAGVSYAWPPVAELKLGDLRDHMNPNAYGVITLYQATRSLLQKSSKEPIFTPIGSMAGCIACVLLSF